MKKNNLLWIGKGHKANTWYHISPFSYCRNVNNYHVLRYEKTSKNIDNAIWHIYNHHNYFIGIIKLFFLGIKVSIKQKIDVIVSFSLFPWAIISWFIAKSTRKKIIIGFVGTDFNYHLKKTIFKKLYFLILKNSDAVSVTGSNMKKWIVKNISIDEKKIVVLPHLIDKSYSNTGSFDYDLIHVSKLTKNKNVECIIKAVALVKKSKKNIKLCILGDGEQRQYLSNLIDQNNLRNNIILKGYKENVFDYYKKSKIFIQASYHEGFSLALLEAISCGLIPIITNAGSEKDYITNNINGLYFNFNNHIELSEKILFALDNDHYNRLTDNVLDLQKSLIVHNNYHSYENIIEAAIR